MAPTFVFKIKYGDVLRRITVPSHPVSNGPEMTYSQLEDTIRQTFKFSSSPEILVTYTDSDDDVITMAGDHDLHDACVLQGLNPLRLSVTIRAAPTEPAVVNDASTLRWGRHGRPQHVPDLKNLMDTTVKFSQDTVKQTADRVTQVLHACEPLKGVPKIMVSEVVESIIKAFSAQPVAGARDDVEHPLGPHVWPSNTSAECPAPAPPVPSPAGPNGDGELGGCSRFMDRTPAMSPDTKDAVLHHGVQCDMCNMCPIVGTRYKSIKQHDYDLCLSCFREFGRAHDYIPMEQAVWRPRFFGGGKTMRCSASNPSCYGGKQPMYMRGPHMYGHHGPYGGQRAASRSGGPFGGPGGKLDARFVQDVTIFDGTELSPGTQFTKIWRLRNSGTSAWPKETQLVHVGGDELGSVFAVTVEVPEQGLAPDGEVEVSADLVAPERPGRYVSHWRLVSPTGQKFGHRVWVLIQVVPKDEQSPQMMESLISSQEPERSDFFTPARDSGEVQLTNESGANMTFLTAKPVNIEFDDLINLDSGPVADEAQVIPDATSGNVVNQEIDLQPIPSLKVEDPEVIDFGKSQEENAAVESSELGNFSMVEMPPSVGMSQETITPNSSNTLFTEMEENPNPVEKEGLRRAAEADAMDVMLENLKTMGFMKRELNIELLKKNNYNMQRTLDDLVTAAEWDPMLEELEEMGFYDTDMNRRLMFKNNGSVKRVVKELVEMSKGKQQI